MIGKTLGDDQWVGVTDLCTDPRDPDVLYAAIELDRRKGAVYRSTDRGSTWTKQSEAVAGGTGPHYYQELYVSPHSKGRIYLADVRIQVSEDHGKTFRRLSSARSRGCFTVRPDQLFAVSGSMTWTGGTQDGAAASDF